MLKQAQSAAIPLSTPKPLIGSLGHLGIFLVGAGNGLTPVASRVRIIPGALHVGCIDPDLPDCPSTIGAPRWLVIFGSLFLINVFFGASDQAPDWTVLGLSFSSTAIFDSIQMTLQAVVILLAADGLSSSVNIMEVAGLLERGGLRGLGFSIGVATNLLPDLRQSSMNAWHSLRMRGGFRAQWWRGIQLLVVTVFPMRCVMPSRSSSRRRCGRSVPNSAAVPAAHRHIGLVAGRRNIRPRRFFVIRIEAMCWLVCFFSIRLVFYIAMKACMVGTLKNVRMETAVCNLLFQYRLLLLFVSKSEFLHIHKNPEYKKMTFTSQFFVAPCSKCDILRSRRG